MGLNCGALVVLMAKKNAFPHTLISSSCVNTSLNTLTTTFSLRKKKEWMATKIFSVVFM